MKVLILLTYYYPHWTGLTQYAVRLAEGLAHKSYRVKVVTTKHESGLKEEEIINGVQVVRKPVLLRISRAFISPGLILSLINQIKAVDRIIVYLPFSESIIVSVICRIFNKKLYLIHNGDLVLPTGIVNRLIEKAYYVSTYLSMLFANAVIIQTADYAQNSPLLARFEHKWRVILPLYKKNKSKSEKEITSNTTIGFAGRFVEEKGFDILLQAIPLIITKIPHAKFLFAGDTNIPYENFFSKNSELISKNQKYLQLKGRLNEQQMQHFYRICRVFVIPSRSDCFPSVGVEAMLAGLPLVVTDIPGARMQVKMTGMGVLVPSVNSAALAEAIIKVLKNKERYVSPKIKKRVQELFDYEKTLRAYETLFTKGD